MKLDLKWQEYLLFSILCTLKAPLYVSLRILRDAFIVLTRDFCIDIYSLFCCQLPSSFHSSKLTLGGTNTQFSEDLYFSKIDFILSFVFLLSQFYFLLINKLIIFGKSAFAGFSRSDSVSTQLIFENYTHLYFGLWLDLQYFHIESHNRQFEKHMCSIRHPWAYNLRLKSSHFLPDFYLWGWISSMGFSELFNEIDDPDLPDLPFLM